MNQQPVVGPSDMRPEEIMSLYFQAHSQSVGAKSALARLATQKRTNDAGAHIARIYSLDDPAMRSQAFFAFDACAGIRNSRVKIVRPAKGLFVS